MASDYQKPRGLTVVLPEDAEDFLSQMDIAKFHGVGKKTVERLHEMGVYTGADLLAIPEMTLIDRFGRFGYDLFRKARGIHNSPVKSHRIRKSIGKERTYRKLLYAEDDILEEIANLSSKVAQSLEKHGKQGKTLVLKVRYGDFTTLTKRITLTEPTREAERINRSARHIFQEIESTNTGIRLLGVTMTNFVDHTELPLVEEKEND